MLVPWSASSDNDDAAAGLGYDGSNWWLQLGWINVDSATIVDLYTDCCSLFHNRDWLADGRVR